MKTIVEARAALEAKRSTPIERDGRRFIDLTPTWAEILPTWMHLIRSGPNAETLENFGKDMVNMAETADRWNLFALANPELADTFMGLTALNAARGVSDDGSVSSCL